MDARNLAAVLILCAGAMWLLWSKLNSLVWFDPAWWLQEMSRFSQGQVPYRDFFWPYPPLAVLVFGTALRLLGGKFWVAQVTLNIFSLAVILGIYFWIRRMLPARLHALCCALVLSVCATTQTYFSVFSFRTTSPSLHVSAAGLLLLLLGVLRYVAQPLPERWAQAFMGAGAFLALTAKQEMIVAVPALFAVLVLFDRRIRSHPGAAARWIRHNAGMAALWFGPAACLYVLAGWRAGFGNMIQGLQGNGLTRIACPWWPTGFGLLAAAEALGFAALVAGVATLTDAKRWRSYLGPRYPLLLAGALVGAGLYALFVATVYHQTVFGPDSLLVKLKKLAPELLSTNFIFRPALWAMIAYWLYLMVRAVRDRRSITGEGLAALLVFTVPVALSPRSLFGTHLTANPEIPAVSYPFVIVLAVYLLLRWLRIPYGLPDGLKIAVPARPGAVAAALMTGYIVVRIVGGYDVLSNRSYTRLETPAGAVQVKDGQVSREILDYVLKETAPGDPILELPDGGGIAFAAGRPSYTFTTLWVQIPTSAEIQALDLQKLRDNPPKVVIGPNSESLGTYYGVMGTNGCMFPSIAWLPDRLSWRPGFVYPAVRWIQENYRVERQVGTWVLMRPVDPLLHAYGSERNSSRDGTTALHTAGVP